MIKKKKSSKLVGKKKRTKSEVGTLSRRKGSQFERDIAEKMRGIYDPFQLRRSMARVLKAKDLSEYRRLMKGSRVRRSDQGKGAKEPDLVIEGCPVWHELQNAAVGFNPAQKLSQAERDIFESKSTLWPVAICHKLGSRQIIVMTRLWVLMRLMGYYFPDKTEDDLIISFDFDRYLRVLKIHEKAN